MSGALYAASLGELVIAADVTLAPIVITAGIPCTVRVVSGTRAYDAYGRIVQESGAAVGRPYAFTGSGSVAHGLGFGECEGDVRQRCR